MKKLLLLGFSMSLSMSMMAQIGNSSLSYGTQIGQTYYDLQSNSATGNRLVRNSDGSLSATWIEHWDFLTVDNEPKPGVRGFGYNHFDPSQSNKWLYEMDGECWEESFGCASQYVGWPEMINLENANGEGNTEMVINHTPLKVTKRSDKGYGSWSQTGEMGIEKDMGEGDWEGTWPRAVVSGNYIHLLITSTDQGGFFDGTGVENPCVYMRSDDGGVTWSDPMSFDVKDDVVQEVITPTVNYDSIGAYMNPQIDSIWSDSVFTGNFMIGGVTFNADAYFDTDTITLTGSQDTIVIITSDTLNSTDTIATRLWTTVDSVSITMYDTIIGADTTYDTVEVNRVNNVGGDAYAIHANGANVAVTFGDGNVGGPNDWVLFKSTDNGDNWERTWVRDNHAIAPIDTSAAGSPILFTNNSNFDIFIDDEGTVHLFAGMTMGDEEGFVYNDPDLYKDLDGGILYWKEGMVDAITVGTPNYLEDENGDDTKYNITGSAFYGHFFAGWPAASYDQKGNIYLIYSAVQEETEFINPTSGDTVGYNDLYMVFSVDNGDTWCRTDDPINIAEDVYGIQGGTPIEDDLYPISVPKVEADGKMHFVWQADYSYPGLALRSQNWPHPNDNVNYINYSYLNMSNMNTCADVPAGPINTIEDLINQTINFSLAPNPANDIITVSADINISKVTITNVFGQTVKMETGNNIKTYTVNISDLSSGVYVVKAETKEGIATQKLDVVR